MKGIAMRKLSTLILGLALTGCAGFSDGYETRPAEAFAAKVEVKGDGLDGYRMARSDKARAVYFDPSGIQSDIYFRAYAYADGRAVVQVYIWTDTPDRWLFPTVLNFGSPLRSVDVKRIDSDTHCAAGVCHQRESTVATLSDDDVRAILDPAAPEFFPVRLVAQGGTVDRNLRRAELEATLEAVGLAGRFS